MPLSFVRQTLAAVELKLTVVFLKIYDNYGIFKEHKTEYTGRLLLYYLDIRAQLFYVEYYCS